MKKTFGPLEIGGILAVAGYAVYLFWPDLHHSVQEVTKAAPVSQAASPVTTKPVLIDIPAPVQAPQQEASASSSHGLSTTDDGPGDMISVLMRRYRSSDPQARHLELDRRIVAMASTPGRFRSDITSGDDGFDNRLISIRRAPWSSLNPVQREIQLEVSKAILDAGDPAVSSSGAIPAQKTAELRAEIAVWNARAPSAAAENVDAVPNSSTPQARLRALTPRLQKQMNRTFVPFAQWDAVSAQEDAKRICDSATVYSITNSQMDRLAKDVARMERAK